MKQFLFISVFAITAHIANAQNWFTTGNAGLNSTNFLGTTENVNLIFKRNNVRAGLLATNSTSFGVNALNVAATGVFNAAFGPQALQRNTTGAGNIAVGYLSLQNNTTGNGNTAIGYRSAFSGSAASGICAFGDSAAHFNTADYTTAVGYSALRKNTTGAGNIAVGFQSLQNNTVGNGNTAMGYRSAFSGSTASGICAFGDSAAYFNTAGYTTAFGYAALRKNTYGDHNIAFGPLALYSNTEGYDNTASGYQVLYQNTTGSDNTANGSGALYSNTTGTNNVAMGSQALVANTTGFVNVAVGNFALSSNRIGFENTAIGNGADVASSSIAYSNATAIGGGTIVDASNKVCVGNPIVSSIGGEVGWTSFSDGRYKRNIKENVQGLAFINSLKPITYTVDINGLNTYYNKNRAHNEAYEKMKKDMQPAADAASEIVYNGFIAQDVEAAAKKLDYNFSGVDKPKTNDGLYGLRYGDFVVPLVKAVQELSGQNQKLKSQNEALEKKYEDQQKEIDELKQMIISNQVTVSGDQLAVISSASLQQNIPNPFNYTTTINYILPIPQTYSSAKIVVTDKSGSVLKEVNVYAKGKGSLQLDASTLSSGAYQYSLYIDGKLIDTKQMVLAK